MNTTRPDGTILTVLDSAPALRFVHIDYTTDLQMPTHTHEDVMSLNFCLSGIHQERENRQTFLRGPSSLSIMPTGVPHANHFYGGASLFLMVLGAPWIQRFRPLFPVLDSRQCFQNGVPAWIAARMYREFLRRDAMTPLALEGMLLELLVELARRGPFFQSDQTRSKAADTPRWLRDATDFLHTHFTESLTSDAIALAAGVHPSHLMRAFRRRHGCTVGEYVRHLRVEYARRLIETSDLPLGQIGLEAGFCDQGHFGRAFKAQTGVSPGEMRRDCRRASHIPKTQFPS